MVSPRESQTCFTPSPTLAASCLTFQNFTLSVPFRCRWLCCTPRLMQEFNQKPQSGRVPKGAPEQTLLQRTKDHKQLRQGRKERARRGMVGLRDETDLLGCAIRITLAGGQSALHRQRVHISLHVAALLALSLWPP